MSAGSGQNWHQVAVGPRLEILVDAARPDPAARLMRASRMNRCLASIAGALIGIGLALTATADPAPAATAPAGDHAVKSAGCGQRGAQLGLFSSKVMVRARPRTYLVQAPDDYDPARAYPLIFVFHGAGTTSQQSYSWGLQNAPGASKNGIFIFPNGVNFMHDGVGWDDRPDGYDLPFFDNMVSDLSKTYCIDNRRIFVAGFSWGGDFAIALACHRGGMLRAVAANSTDDEYRNTADYTTYNGLPCKANTHPAVRFAHAVGGDKEYPAPDFATTSKLFQYMNACAGASTRVTSSSSAMSCVSFNSCASGYEECSFDTRIGHTLPPNWAQDTWGFFSNFE